MAACSFVRDLVIIFCFFIGSGVYRGMPDRSPAECQVCYDTDDQLVMVLCESESVRE